MVVVYVSNFYTNVLATHWQIRFDCRKYENSEVRIYVHIYILLGVEETTMSICLTTWQDSFSFALANATHENIK